MRNPKVLSIGTLGNTEIDIKASSSHDWCQGLYLKPENKETNLCTEDRIKELNIQMNKRIDKPRFGSIIKGNYKIFLAFIKVYIKFRNM